MKPTYLAAAYLTIIALAMAYFSHIHLSLHIMFGGN